MSHAPAAIVLAGGRSTRMGASKAALDWHGMPLLARIAGIAGREFAPVLVVAERRATRAGRRRAGRGPPSPGAARWRGSLPACGRWTGAPTRRSSPRPTRPSCTRRFCRASQPRSAITTVAVPVADGREHPLAACWSLAALAAVEAALAADRLRVRSLLGELDVAFVDGGTLEHPESLRNLNTPADYRGALWASRCLG